MILDEWLLHALTNEEAALLLEIINARRQSKQSNIFCSQFDIDGWYEKLGDGTLAEAILDRIVHDSYDIFIDGKVSMRERFGVQQEASHEESDALVGGSQVIPIDVRIITASNKNLLQCVKDGAFREDLYFRISVLQLFIPPLHLRKEDIPQLFRHFLRNNKHLSNTLTDKEMDLLLSYNWPGNIRELENVAERFSVLAKGSNLTTGTVYRTLERALTSTPSFTTENLDNMRNDHIFQEALILSEDNKELAAQLIEDILQKASFKISFPSLDNMHQLTESELIQQALILSDGNLTKAAKRIGISRTTLWRRLKESENNQG